jgi:hypothetical protein
MRRTRLITGLIIALALIIFLAIYSHSNNQTPLKSGKTLPDEVLNVAKQYIQAREDSMGADQSSPTSWVNSVKGVLSEDWFNKLQPPASSTTGSTPYNFTFAHQNGYVIKSNLSHCGVNDILFKPTDSNAVVACSLEDQTVKQSTGVAIAAADLPLGWSYVGKQTPPQILLVKQNGKWLIDGDATAQGQ